MRIPDPKQLMVFSLLALLVMCRSSVTHAGDDFSSDAARISRASGSPVGPTTKIIICHNGHSIKIGEHSLPTHLAHGDSLGACPNDVVICHHGNNEILANNTITVNENQLSAHLAHGDTLGPCADQVFMCNNLGHTIVVASYRVADHLARGQTVGICPGHQLLCHKGKTIKVADRNVLNHLAHGDFLGYCLGGQGPVISSNSLPAQISP